MTPHSLTTRPPLGELTLPQQLVKEHNRTMRPHLNNLLKSSRILNLSVETTFTAAVLLQRYKIASQEENVDAWIIAICLLLACKREEEPRRLRDFINCSYLMQNRPLPDLDDAYWEAKKKIVRTEQNVLRWLEFDIAVSRPHRAIVAFLLHLSSDDNDEDQFKCRILARRAFQKLNGAMFYVEALQQDADVLGIAALRLALIDSETSTTLSEERRNEVLGFSIWGDRFGIERPVESILQVQDIVKRATTDQD